MSEEKKQTTAQRQMDRAETAARGKLLAAIEVWICARKARNAINAAPDTDGNITNAVTLRMGLEAELKAS